jgi:hypothetical protein
VTESFAVTGSAIAARAPDDLTNRPLVTLSSFAHVFLPPQAFDFDTTAFHHETLRSLYFSHDGAVADELDGFTIEPCINT